MTILELRRSWLLFFRSMWSNKGFSFADFSRRKKTLQHRSLTYLRRFLDFGDEIVRRPIIVVINLLDAPGGIDDDGAEVVTDAGAGGALVLFADLVADADDLQWVAGDEIPVFGIVVIT